MAKESSLSPGDAVAITPSDTLDVNLNGVYVGGTGDLTVQTETPLAAATNVLFQTLPAGTQIMLRIKRVMATGTTATKITGYRS